MWGVAFVFLFSAIFGHTTTCRAQDPYISRVYEYRPAPGQFTNMLPMYEDGDNERMMRAKAEECIANHNQEMICLGGWGGYVTFGFDHMLVNVPGEYDMKILGNAFYANDNPKDTTARGGSAEPGVVMVSYDTNGNGKPDDEWYELAGSEYYQSTTHHNYSMTYYRPGADHVATPSLTDRTLIDTTYIRWTNSLGQQGYMPKNKYHRQNYYPNWIEADSLTFEGTLMRNNGIDESGNGTYYVLYSFEWGYVDNQPNSLPDEPEMHASEFNLDWAVDADGRPVQLSGVHFVRVYTGLNQYCGAIGETSTEVMDAWDLHPEALPTGVSQPSREVVRATKQWRDGQIRIYRGQESYTILGTKIR